MSHIHSDKKLPIFSNTDFDQLTPVCSKNSHYHWHHCIVAASWASAEVQRIHCLSDPTLPETQVSPLWLISLLFSVMKCAQTATDNILEESRSIINHTCRLASDVSISRWRFHCNQDLKLSVEPHNQVTVSVWMHKFWWVCETPTFS